jgi:hypothetical protein
MTTSPRILIAGAGWRVSHFVVPALLAVGVRRDDITIVRRQAGEAAGPLSGIRTIQDVDRAGGPFRLTINCVPEHLLLAMQLRLLQLQPNAIQFCDTPILYRFFDLGKARKAAKAINLFSLEDWPLMPNLRSIWPICAESPHQFHLRFEHFGIPTHFLSAARTAYGQSGKGVRRFLRREKEGLIDLKLGTRARCVLKGPKHMQLAKISMSDGRQLIEDFFELTNRGEIPGAVASGDVIWRRLDGTLLSYYKGSECFHKVRVPAEISALYTSSGSRASIHELDKCVALIDIFRSALEGRPKAYGFYQSVEDALFDRITRRFRVAWPRCDSAPPSDIGRGSVRGGVDTRTKERRVAALPELKSLNLPRSCTRSMTDGSPSRRTG